MKHKIEELLSQKFLIKKHFHLFLLSLILIAAGFLRFYNTPERYGFDPDAIRDAIIALHGANTLQFPLTGPVSAIGQFHFGPWYYMQLILFHLAVPMDYSPWIYMSIISLLIIFVMYKIGELLKNKTFGLILAGLAALSPAQIAPATGLSNPNLVTIQAVLAIWIFIVLIKKTPSSWWSLFLGIAIGIGINNHYQMLSFILLPFLLLFINTKKRFMYIFLSLAGIFLTFIPLFIFDLTHSQLATRGFIDTITNRQINYVPNRWLFYLRDFWPAFWSYTLGIPTLAGATVILSAILITIFYFLKKKLSSEYKMLIIPFIILFFLLRYYPGQRETYYLLFLHPFIFIFTGMIFYLFINSKRALFKYLGISVFLIFLIFIFFTNISQIHSFESHTTAVAKAKQIAASYPNKKFTIYSCKGIADYDTQAVMFVLHNMNKLDDQGIKIGLLSKNCSAVSEENPVLHTNKESLNLSSVSERELTKWTVISEESVYNHYANWYQNKL